MPSTKRLGRRLVAGIAAAGVALLLAELGALGWLHWCAAEPDFQRYASITELRARYGEFDRFRAHRHMGYVLAPGYRKGGNRHNALGYRGDEIARAKAPGTLRIACCGGSTVYGEGVIDDYRLSMPYLLEQALRSEGRAVEVINAGCPGWTTLESLIDFETRLLDLEADVAIVYHGINDVLPRMVWPHDAYRGDWSGWLCRDEHVATASLLERSALARILMVRGGRLEPHGSLLRIIGEAPPSSRMFVFRTQRMSGTYPSGVFRDVPIEQMLAANPPIYFERNLRTMLATAAEHGVRVLLTTFAFSREWPGQAYIGHPAVQAAIEEFNALVLGLGRQRGAAALDLQPQLVAKELFTDGVHFTAAGNRRRVELLLPALRDLLR